jgi:hypothetical protein
MDQPNGKQIKPVPSKKQILELLAESDKNPHMTVKIFCRLHKVTEGSFLHRAQVLSFGECIKTKSSHLIHLHLIQLR